MKILLVLLICVWSAFLGFSQDCLDMNTYDAHFFRIEELCEEIDLILYMDYTDQAMSNHCPNDTRKDAMEIRSLFWNKSDSPFSSTFEVCIDANYSNNDGEIISIEMNDFTNVTETVVVEGVIPRKKFCGDITISVGADDVYCVSAYAKFTQQPKPPFYNYFKYKLNSLNSAPCNLLPNSNIFSFDPSNGRQNFIKKFDSFYEINGNVSLSELVEIFPYHSNGFYVAEDAVLTIDTKDYLSDKYSFRYPMVLDKNAKIKVIPNGLSSEPDGDIRYMDLFGCKEHMWQGIEVTDGASLNLDSLRIRDAYKAIDIKGAGSISLTNSTLEDNYYGIYSSTTASGQVDFPDFKNNTFRGIGTMKKTPSGSIPSRPIAGIYMKRNENDFYNLSAPANAKNKYENLNRAFSLSGAVYTADNNTIKNCNIGFKGANGWIKAKDNLIDNVNKGVDVDESGLTLESTVINAHRYGVQSWLNQNKIFRIRNTTISSKKYGIYDFYNFGGDISNNTISITQNAPNNYGISLFRDRGVIGENNTITIGQGKAGMQFNLSPFNNFSNDNVINLTNSTSGIHGISLLSSNNFALWQNDINGPGSSGYTESTGIFAIDSPRGWYRCNAINNVEEGILYEGSNIESRYRGNEFRNNGRGLQLTNPSYPSMTITGRQVHHGNKWIGSNTKAVSYNTNSQYNKNSQVIYDLADGSNLKPNQVIGDDWFRKESGSTYTCAISPINPPTKDGYDEYINIVENDTLISDPDKWKLKYHIFCGIFQKQGTERSPREVQFCTNHAGENILRYARIKTALDQALVADPAIHPMVHVISTDIDQYNSAPSAALYTAIRKKLTDYNMLIAHNKQARKLELGKLYNELMQITPSSDIEHAYLRSTAILVNYLRNDAQLTKGEESELHTLADACAYVYPQSVYTSRGILNTINDALVWDVDQGCRSPRVRQAVASDSDALSVSPNPAYHTIRITGGSGSYELLRMDGSRIRTIDTEDADLRSVPTGIYTIRDTATGEATKFIKIQ